MCSSLFPWFRRRFTMSKHQVPAEHVSPPGLEPSSTIRDSQKTLHQRALLLQAPKQAYFLIPDHPVPSLKPGEVLVRNCAIGLNPIDWKAPDFNFGIPAFPYLSGRELAGQVDQPSSHIRQHDRVIVISTDYRDPRKGAYQSYVAALDYNVARIPSHVSYESAATVGVAFVTAALALGVSLGVDFSSAGGPDLFSIVRSIDEKRIPEDTRAETLSSIEDFERASAGDWLIIWGGSAVSANIAAQLARLAGLRIALVVDQARHGDWISESIRPDMLIDSHDEARAVQIIRSAIGAKAKFGIDTRSKESAELLAQSLQQPSTTKSLSPPSTPPPDSKGLSSHLISLAGSPKQKDPNVIWHAVPIKLFHELPEVGRPLTLWLETLLEKGLLAFPRIVDVEFGLHNVNNALDRMRRGEIRGGKLVVKLE